MRFPSLPGPRYRVVKADYKGDTTYIAWDDAESSAPIYVLCDDGEWVAMPYQTASVQNCEWELIRLVLGFDKNSPELGYVEFRYVDEDE